MRFTVGRPKVAVVGAGWWATQFLIPGLLGFEGADLLAVVEPDGKRLAAACKEFGLDRGFGSVHELLSEVPVDGIVVATPNASHYAVPRRSTFVWGSRDGRETHDTSCVRCVGTRADRRRARPSPSARLQPAVRR